MEGIRLPLTLVIAPAGFGKTTLVAASLTGCSMPVAWLSLDRDDN
jgi:LuxR family maltose regulon positive regulatory protein